MRGSALDVTDLDCHSAPYLPGPACMACEVASSPAGPVRGAVDRAGTPPSDQAELQPQHALASR